MKIDTIDIEAAGTCARDCELIFLSCDDEFKINYHKNEDNTYWEMQCEGALAFKFISEKFSAEDYLKELPAEGAFFEILESSWIAEFNEKKIRTFDKYRHYFLRFCDESIAIIAQSLIFKRLKEKPKNNLF